METRINQLTTPYFSGSEYMSVEPMSTDIKMSYKVIDTCEAIHSHDDVEIVYVTHGKGFITINGESYPLSAGSMVRLFPFHIHKITSESIDPLKIYCCRFSLGVTMSFALSNTGHEKSRYVIEYGCPVVAFDQCNADRVKENFEMVLIEQQNKEVLNELMVLSIIMRIMFYYERESIKDIELQATTTRGLAWEMIQYIQINFSRNLTSSMLAEKFGISVMEINRMLRFLTGENFTQNLNRVRIRNACAIMLFDDLSIKYIGKYVGYSTTASFYRAFKKIKNMTPENYRKDNKSNTQTVSDEKSWSIIQYIINNYMNEITSDSAAKELFISEMKIKELLEKNYGSTFSKLRTGIRIQYACALLKASQAPISDISYAVGFGSTRSFTRSFLELIGTTATQYRGE